MLNSIEMCRISQRRSLPNAGEVSVCENCDVPWRAARAATSDRSGVDFVGPRSATPATVDNGAVETRRRCRNRAHTLVGYARRCRVATREFRHRRRGRLGNVAAARIPHSPRRGVYLPVLEPAGTRVHRRRRRRPRWRRFIRLKKHLARGTWTLVRFLMSPLFAKDNRSAKPDHVRDL